MVFHWEKERRKDLIGFEWGASYAWTALLDHMVREEGHPSDQPITAKAMYEHPLLLDALNSGELCLTLLQLTEDELRDCVGVTPGWDDERDRNDRCHDVPGQIAAWLFYDMHADTGHCRSNGEWGVPEGWYTVYFDTAKLESWCRKVARAKRPAHRPIDEDRARLRENYLRRHAAGDFKKIKEGVLWLWQQDGARELWSSYESVDAVARRWRTGKR